MTKFVRLMGVDQSRRRRVDENGKPCEPGDVGDCSARRSADANPVVRQSEETAASRRKIDLIAPGADDGGEFVVGARHVISSRVSHRAVQ